MKTIKCQFIFVLIAATLLLACTKGVAIKTEMFKVSASKMIRLGSNDQAYAEAELGNKIGYEYKAVPQNAFPIKATVNLPGVDETNPAVTGSVLLNVAVDNSLTHASFNTEPLAKEIAYGMMLDYNSKALQTLSAISYSIGGYVENNIGGNTNVDAILSKLNNRQEANQLSITYQSGRQKITIVIFKQSDGRYIFSCRG